MYHPTQQGYRTIDLETCAGTICKEIARDAANSPNVRMRRVHLVVLSALVALGSVPGFSAPNHGATSGTVSGQVRDTAGVPQIGVVVELLQPDLTLIASVFTDANGRFSISNVLPGRYAVKAMGTSFLPSLREDVRARTSAVVNLTLNTLYEAMQWLPAKPRTGDNQADDWVYTLRSAANHHAIWRQSRVIVSLEAVPTRERHV